MSIDPCIVVVLVIAWKLQSNMDESTESTENCWHSRLSILCGCNIPNWPEGLGPWKPDMFCYSHMYIELSTNHLNQLLLFDWSLSLTQKAPILLIFLNLTWWFFHIESTNCFVTLSCLAVCSWGSLQKAMSTLSCIMEEFKTCY